MTARVALALAVGLAAAGCLHANTQFVRTDPSFQPRPVPAPPQILWDADETKKIPPFLTVGVLEVRRKEVDNLDTFAAYVSSEGSERGCEVLAQRDVYEMRTRTFTNPNTLGPAMVWRPNGYAAWQFYCGVRTAAQQFDEGDAKYSRSVATEAALKLRADGRGDVSCSKEARAGTHIRSDTCR